MREPTWASFDMKSMDRLFVHFSIFLFSLLLCSCRGNSNQHGAQIDKRCPELVLKAEINNKRTANGTKEGPKGISARIEYEDTVYRIIQVVNETIIPVDRIKMAYENIKQDMIADISSSTGSERKEFEQAVKYRVTFEHIVISKGTGNVITRSILKPDEIAEALKKQMTPSEELEVYVATLRSKLPREIEPGYMMTDINYNERMVDVKIVVDENRLDFNQATQIGRWSKELQALTLADLTTGFSFWSKLAEAYGGISFYYIGSKGYNYLPVVFSENEVGEYNKLMNKVKQQQFR